MPQYLLCRYLLELAEQGQCIERLSEIKALLKDEFDKGKIDESNYELLYSRVEEYMEKLKQG